MLKDAVELDVAELDVVELDVAELDGVVLVAVDQVVVQGVARDPTLPVQHAALPQGQHSVGFSTENKRPSPVRHMMPHCVPFFKLLPQETTVPRALRSKTYRVYITHESSCKRLSRVSDQNFLPA